MPTVESLHQLLEEATRLLDRAAHEIRDLPLKPTQSNIRHIGKALGEIFELREQIYALRPSLQPAHLQGPLSNPEAALSRLLERVAHFEKAGAIETAEGLLRNFIDNQTAEDPLARARSELESLRRRNGS